MSWRETARAFQTSWEAVYRSVEWFVQWGLAHRELRGIESIGVDEIHWGRGLRADKFLTVIYQIDAPCPRPVGGARQVVGAGRGASILFFAPISTTGPVLRGVLGGGPPPPKNPHRAPPFRVD